VPASVPAAPDRRSAAPAPESEGAPSRHALVFAGECLEHHDRDEVQARVAAALKLDAARTAHLFSGRRVVLRRDLDTATALRRAARLAALGARVLIEPPPPAWVAEPAARLPAPTSPATTPAAPKQPADTPPTPAAQAPTAAAPDLPTPLPTAVPTPPSASIPAPARARWRVPGVALGIAAAVVGTAGGVALAPHLSAWLWSNTAATTSRSAGGPVTGAVERPAPAAAPAPVPQPATVAAVPSPVPPVAPAPVAPPPAPQAPPPPQSATMPAFVRAMTGEARFEFGGPYSAAPQHRAFAISGDGAHGWTAGAPSENQARAGALERCIRTGPARDGCRVVDVNGLAQE
jgi:hypothetical protein